MEAVSALRIELYNELHGLPEALRSDFPDLAVDFLATVFRPAAAASPAKQSQQQSSRPPDPPSERSAPLSQFRLLPSSGADDKDALALGGEVQTMLEAVQREAVAIEATAGATPATGWGDLALPLVVPPAEQLKQLTAQQRSTGGRRSPSPAAGRPQPPPPLPAQLLECRRCRKVLMACAAVQHQRQCSQLPEATVAQPGGGEASLSQSDGPSSSEEMPVRAPSVSRGSKRKRPSGSAAAAGGAKASRMSKGGSMRAGSVELTPSIGEVVQGKLQPPVQPLLPAQAALVAPPPEVVAAVTAAPQAFPAGLPPDVAAAFALPPDVMAAFGVQPPAAAMQVDAAAAPAPTIAAAAAPAIALGAAPSTAAAAAPAAAAAAPSPPPEAKPRAPLSPTIRLTQQQRRPRSQHPPRMKRRLLHLHPVKDLAEPLVLNEAASPAARQHSQGPAAGVAAAAAAVKAEPVVAAAMGQPGPGQFQPAAAAAAAPAAAAAAAGGAAGISRSVPPNYPASAAQQQALQPQVQPAVANPGVPQMQPSVQHLTAQQQQARAQRYYEQCRIFSSLAPEEQQRMRQIALQRQQTQAAQQQLQAQTQAAGQPPSAAPQALQQGIRPMAAPGAVHYQPGMVPQGGATQQMPQHLHPQQQQQQPRPQQPSLAAAPYAVMGMAVRPTGTAAATVGMPLGSAHSPAVPGSMPLPTGSRPVMVSQQQLMMFPGMAMPMRPGMVALPAGTAALAPGARPVGVALPSQMQHMQQQAGMRPCVQQMRPAGLPGYPAARPMPGAAQQHLQAYPAGMMVVPAGFAMGVPFGGSTAQGTTQAAASPVATSMPSRLADTASSPPTAQQPAMQFHPYVRPAVVAGMPATVGMPAAALGMPLSSVPAQPLMQQPGAAAPSMQFIPNQ